MASFTLKLGDDFLHIPKLTSGKNWVIYKDRLTLSVQAHGLRAHLDGTATKPTEPMITQAPANKELTAEEEKITMYGDDLKEWFQKEAIVSQQVVSMIPNLLYLKIREKPRKYHFFPNQSISTLRKNSTESLPSSRRSRTGPAFFYYWSPRIKSRPSRPA